MKHKLLIAVDSEKTSWKAVEYVARACGGTNDEGFGIVVFHVLPPIPAYNLTGDARVSPGDILDWFDNQTRAAATDMLAKMKALLLKEGVKSEQVSTEIAKQRGIIAPQILQAAADHNCDTIVVGRRGRSLVASFFLGSVVEHLLRNPVGFAIWVVE